MGLTSPSRESEERLVGRYWVGAVHTSPQCRHLGSHQVQTVEVFDEDESWFVVMPVPLWGDQIGVPGPSRLRGVEVEWCGVCPPMPPSRGLWAERGACWGTEHPGFFVGENGSDPGPDDERLLAEAKAMCASCPVARECDEWALSMDGMLASVSYHDGYVGVAAGRGARERKKGEYPT